MCTLPSPSYQPTIMVRRCTNIQASLTKIHLVPVVVPDGKDKGFELALCQFDATVLLPHNRVCSESNTSAMCTDIIALNLKQSCTRTYNCSPLTNSITRSPWLSIWKGVHAVVNNKMLFCYASLIELHTIFISHIYCNLSGTVHVPLMLPYLRVSGRVFAMCNSADLDLL